MAEPENPRAFPVAFSDDYLVSYGMTLRDYFAAKAMQGMFAADTAESVMSVTLKAEYAYEMADAMLYEREV